jgi:hypothetical protein
METNDILDILKRIEERLDKIEYILEKNKLSSEKMVEHIEFIDTIYDNIKKPFSKVLSYYNGNEIQIEKKNCIKN